jgi:O-methyltransferase
MKQATSPDQPTEPEPAPTEAERAQAFNIAVQRLREDHRGIYWGDRMLTLDKSAGFLDDPVFAAALSAIRGSHVYDQYNAPDTIAWRLHTLVWAAEQAVQIEGDFVECGTFKGDMAFVIATILGNRLEDRTFRLFDSFEGFSPALARPDDYPDNPGFIEFANGIYGQDGLHGFVSDRFHAMRHVKVIKGFLPESLDGETPDRIAFLHLDLNSSRAEIACLELLFDRMSPGGVVVLDDYGWKAFRPQKLAEDGFFRERGYSVLELPTGQGLVMRR